MTRGASNPHDGVSVPPDEVEAHLACGWQLLNPCPDCDAVRLAPPCPEKDSPK